MKNLHICLVFSIITLLNPSLTWADFSANTPEVYAVIENNEVPLGGEEGLVAGQSITDELSVEGITFAPYVYWDPDPFWFGAPNQVGNFSDTDHLESFSIKFNEAVSNAAFVIWIADNTPVKFTSLLNGNIVEVAEYVNPTLDPPSYVGFLNTQIDEIKIEVGTERAIIDYLAFTPYLLTEKCDVNKDGKYDRDDLLKKMDDCFTNNAGTPNFRKECLVDMVILATQCPAYLP
jgi:hypothetical protein